METIFSRILVQIRKDAGFPTAYRFYHDNGGKNVLKISYRKYLLIEQGKNLPVPGRLTTLMATLRLIQGTDEANAFVRAWVETMMGTENFRELLAPLIKAKPGIKELSPMQKAMKNATVARTYFLSLEQTETIYANRDNYLCHIATSNDAGSWTAKELAASLMMTEAAAKKALKALARAKLVKEIKKNVFTSPLAPMLIQYPRMNTIPMELRKKIRDYDSKLAATGKQTFSSRAIIRADETAFRNFIPIMDVNLDTAQTYSVTQKTDASALFMVKGEVIKLRDF